MSLYGSLGRMSALGIEAAVAESGTAATATDTRRVPKSGTTPPRDRLGLHNVVLDGTERLATSCHFGIGGLVSVSTTDGFVASPSISLRHKIFDTTMGRSGSYLVWSWSFIGHREYCDGPTFLSLAWHVVLGCVHCIQWNVFGL